MTDDMFLAPAEAFLLDPPVGVPELAPLDMPRRPLRRLPVDFSRLLPRPVLLGRATQHSRNG